MIREIKIQDLPKMLTAKSVWNALSCKQTYSTKF